MKMRSRGDKITKAEHERRITIVDHLMAKGGTRAEVVATMRQLYAPTKDKPDQKPPHPVTVGRYMVEVRQRWKKHQDEHAPFALAEQKLRLARVIRKLHDKDQYREAFPYERLLAEMSGFIGPAVAVQVNAPTFNVPADLAQLSDAELVQRAQEMARALGDLPQARPAPALAAVPEPDAEEGSHFALHHEREAQVVNIREAAPSAPSPAQEAEPRPEPPGLPGSHPVHRVGLDPQPRPLSLDARTPPHLRVG